MIIDPWGKILAKAGSKEEILSTTVDFDQINITRKKNPINNSSLIGFELIVNFQIIFLQCLLKCL